MRDGVKCSGAATKGDLGNAPEVSRVEKNIDPHIFSSPLESR